MNKVLELNKEYDLDLSGGSPVKVKTISFEKNGVKCQYLNSYPDRFEILDYDLFKINGLTIKKEI